MVHTVLVLQMCGDVESVEWGGGRNVVRWGCEYVQQSGWAEFECGREDGDSYEEGECVGTIVDIQSELGGGL